MRILRYNGKLVEEISSVENKKVVWLRYLKEDDKEKCPHCGKPLETTIDIVENCPNWNERINGVETDEVKPYITSN